MYNGCVTATTEATEYNANKEVVWHDFKVLDKFTIPKRRFNELKKCVRKGFPYQAVSEPFILSHLDYHKECDYECTCWK